MAESVGTSNASLSGSEASQVLNPFTPMAFLPPELASQAVLAGFVVACSLSVLIWDILHHLEDDFHLAFKKRFRFPTAVYFLSRIATLVYLVGKNVQLNSEITHCRAMEYILCGAFVVAHSATSLLFYIRVCAVYGMQRYIVTFFGMSWLIVVAGAAATFTAQEGVHIGPTLYCTSRLRNRFIIATSATDLFNDSLIFIAILYRLSIANLPNGGDSSKRGIWDPVRRLATLQGFTKSFLQDSQIYYLIAVIMNFTTVVTFFAVHHPQDSPFRVVFIFPNTVVVNIMACRVFRNVQFGRHNKVMFTNTIGPMEFRPGVVSESYSMSDTQNRHRSVNLGSQISRSQLSGPLIVSMHSEAFDTDSEKAQGSGVSVTKVVEFS
ncbi:hypothetical protein GALMADRAFT_213922 [Galerina marginata CBS 339.88]|uniref:Uncharacterized protein n=1 Tax=Galerina marginata (strain CBS 339.88) TaxID=685588 RepID=A0A067SL68_GALM3|nr:hypothetical protein GALMADRAFT_213922 [Galerina marginata CBS 339.88]